MRAASVAAAAETASDGSDVDPSSERYVLPQTTLVVGHS
jgi:hypothetical protein